jgi:hypothetical protein
VIRQILKDKALDDIIDMYAIFMNLCNNSMIINNLEDPLKIERSSFKKMSYNVAGSPIKRGNTLNELYFTSEKRLKRNSLMDVNKLDYNQESTLDFDATKTPMRGTLDVKQRQRAGFQVDVITEDETFLDLVSSGNYADKMTLGFNINNDENLSE